MQLHDTKNILIGLYISAHDTTDIHSIRDTIEKCMEIMGMDSNFLKNTKVGERKENILSFINYKKLKSTKKLIFITNIYYCELHPNVPFSVILYMLGTLLDNAIESKTNKPILMEVYVAKEKLEISVANEYNQKNRDDFEKMFQEGYSSKSTKQLTPSRGYGLSNLSSVVKSYGGDVLLEYGYNKEQKGDYLTIKIEIKT